MTVPFSSKYHFSHTSRHSIAVSGAVRWEFAARLPCRSLLDASSSLCHPRTLFYCHCQIFLFLLSLLGSFFLVIAGLRPGNPSPNRHSACFFMDSRVEPENDIALKHPTPSLEREVGLDFYSSPKAQSLVRHGLGCPLRIA